jgi:lipopolysaccharide transport system permease protein
MKLSQYKEIIKNLVITELKLKYKNTFFGFLWAMLEPLTFIFVFFFVFTKLFKPDIDNYVSFLLVGFISWNFFLYGTNRMDCIVSKDRLVTKIYFPRELIVFSSSIVILIVSSIEFLILLTVLVALHLKITVNIIYLPLLILIQYLFILGIALAFNALYVKFRDLNHIWGVLMQAMFFMTPILYPNSLLMTQAPYLLIFNPMSHFITNYRRVILYGQPLSLDSIFLLIFLAFLSLGIGLIIFNSKKNTFAEEV